MKDLLLNTKIESLKNIYNGDANEFNDKPNN